MRVLVAAIFAIMPEFAIVVIYYLVDRGITNKRLKENQIAWDNFSKNMTYNEKICCYLKWCQERKIEKGWSDFYFPKM